MKIGQLKHDSVFICYARKDSAHVEELYAKLATAGFQPWMDTRDINPGEDWELALSEAIKRSPLFIACLSKHSSDRRGTLQKEIREALEVWREKLENDIYLIPVRLEDCAVPRPLARFQWVDLFQSEGFDKLTTALRVGLERLRIIQPLPLRTQAIVDLTEEDVKVMLQERDFYDENWYWMGKGIFHDYEVAGGEDAKVVVDHATRLIWQHCDSRLNMTYKDALSYVADLNARASAGFVGWRLPTLEEGMSLIEPRKKDGEHLNGPFDARGHMAYSWTCDIVQWEYTRPSISQEKYRAPRGWVFGITLGKCFHYPLDGINATVRAVCSHT